MWRITVTHECIASGVCVGIAPDRFELDDAAGQTHPITPDVEPGERILDAVASCPMEAISVVDLETGETVEV